MDDDTGCWAEVVCDDNDTATEGCEPREVWDPRGLPGAHRGVGAPGGCCMLAVVSVNFAANVWVVVLLTILVARPEVMMALV